MQVTLIGKRNVNFTAKDGKPVDFVELHMILLDKHVFGQKCLVLNTSLPEAKEAEVNKSYDLYFEPTASGKARLAYIVPNSK